MTRLRPPQFVLLAGAALFAAMMAGGFAAFRASQADFRAVRAREGLVQRHQADFDQLARYLMAEAELRKAPAPVVEPALPPDILPPSSHQLRRLAEKEGWRQVDWEASWSSLKTPKAFSVVARVSKLPEWRVADFQMTALPDGENISLSLRLTTAEPVE